MPETKRRQTTRAVAETAQDRPVTIRSDRRFFTAQGNDRATREARALASALGAGVDLSNNLATRANERGRQAAETEAGLGKERDVANVNEGYDNKWQELDAEHDLNAIEMQLPEYLIEHNAEDLSEKEVSGLIDDFLEHNYKGLDVGTRYGQVMAPALFKLEQAMLLTHREQQLEALQSEQRTRISTNAQSRYTRSKLDSEDGLTGTYDYEYVAEETKTFIAGTDKVVGNMETILEAAIANADVSIIDNAPQQFKDGTKTGFGDPAYAKPIRQARASALAAADRKNKEAIAQGDRDLNSAALQLVVSVNNGVTPTASMIEDYAAMPGADATVTAALSKTLVTINNNVDSLAADPAVVGELSRAIYAREPGGSMRSISQSYINGELGDGQAGVNQFQELLALTKQNDAINRTGKNEEFDFYSKDIDARYPVQRGPLGNVLNPVMGEINRQALLEFRQAKLAGEDIDKAWENITERFDARRDRIAPQAQPEARPAEIVTTDFLSNKATVQELQGSGLTNRQVLELDITEEQKIKLLDGLAARF